MTPSKPYLIRAIYEWITDNNLTPYIAVDATVPDTMVPDEYIKDGEIVLDISATAANNLTISNDSIEFKARFGAISHNIYIPILAVMVIYAQENDQGMAFPPEEFDSEEYEHEEDDDIVAAPQKSKAKLTLITGGKN